MTQNAGQLDPTAPELETLIPSEARVLARVARSDAGTSWCTIVWRASDGRFGAVIAEMTDDGVVTKSRHEGLTQLGELDLLLARDLGREGPRGPARLVVLSSGAAAFEQAGLRAA
ncbi:MAG: hypothetical protein AAF533_17010 [Acidobacteriota bacterium]